MNESNIDWKLYDKAWNDDYGDLPGDSRYGREKRRFAKRNARRSARRSLDKIPSEGGAE